MRGDGESYRKERNIHRRTQLVLQFRIEINLNQSGISKGFFKDTSPKVITTLRTPHFQSAMQLNLSGISRQLHLVTVLF